MVTMLKRKTVFIVGAGASCEAGLPSGQELLNKIAGSLRRENGRALPSSYRLQQALASYNSETHGTQWQEISAACGAICDAAPLSLSIDNFLDAHRGNKIVEICGKLAIAEAILDAERNSKMFVESQPYSRDYPKIDHTQLVGTWYPKLFQLLSEGVDREDLDDFFGNAAFVVFNYDRCVEHFLCEALQTYYALKREDAQHLVGRARFFHPYGTVGPLDWQDGMGISLGAEVNGAKLLNISGGLRTFTERIEDEKALDVLQDVTRDAEMVVFLGFAFHEQNMKLLKLAECKRAFATAYKMSESDCRVVAREIGALSSGPRDFDMQIRNDLTCVGLFEQYWRSLRAG
jgi:hypothetical protein